MSSKDDSRISAAHSHDIDVNQRIIYLMGVEDHPDSDYDDPGIDFRQANRFIRNINLLSSINDEDPILICIKSPGGSVDEGFAIFDAIQSSPMPVTILGYSCIASMATVIFQAANKRVVMPYSSFMIHQISVEGSGTLKHLSSHVNWAEQYQSYLMDIYVDVMKTAPHGKARHWSRKRIREWLTAQMDKKEDVYMTAEQAVQWGFADSIFYDWPSLFKYTSEEMSR